MSEEVKASSSLLPGAPATSGTASRPVIVEEPGEDEENVRRRRRRRRRRSLKADGPEKRIRLFLFGLVIVLLIVAVTGAQVGAWLKDSLVVAKPWLKNSGLVDLVKKFLRWEVIALVIAGVILLYLQPEVEERVLKALGIKKERNRRSSSSRR
ncbi:MAG: hypothetical protein OHK0029_00280 [Armatimonadaceae bacterium]